MDYNLSCASIFRRFVTLNEKSEILAEVYALLIN